ncbi:MAG: hypothetical protein H7Z74_06425 [Anaerolineae bacterium]|nr:hypothetical protein [Gemmatimonadaceae bacterium]
MPDMPDMPPMPEMPQEPMIFGPGDFMSLPEGVVAIVIGFWVMIAVIVVGWPIARALARRMDRQVLNPQMPADFEARLQRIENIVESTAIEVERISEGQRFATKLLSEREGVSKQR